MIFVSVTRPYDLLIFLLRVSLLESPTKLGGTNAKDEIQSPAMMLPLSSSPFGLCPRHDIAPRAALLTAGGATKGAGKLRLYLFLEAVRTFTELL